jgi:hypothetical protein
MKLSPTSVPESVLDLGILELVSLIKEAMPKSQDEKAVVSAKLTVGHPIMLYRKSRVNRPRTAEAGSLRCFPVPQIAFYSKFASM